MLKLRPSLEPGGVAELVDGFATRLNCHKRRSDAWLGRFGYDRSSRTRRWLSCSTASGTSSLLWAPSAEQGHPRSSIPCCGGKRKLAATPAPDQRPQVSTFLVRPDYFESQTAAVRVSKTGDLIEDRTVAQVSCPQQRPDQPIAVGPKQCEPRAHVPSLERLAHRKMVTRRARRSPLPRVLYRSCHSRGLEASVSTALR
jgi:hypothetical protein